ncbi:peptide-methionine (S)-S-oxide reductase MsrA [Psychroflexus gondwanensis]|jgi:peptide-methionine (S)-S-oxide reductase|uniref:peptide-methionine (S)-S-oxide reductase MsrA n=1 Tax=Psychroflexus gondwanensis TaxID=251 RepID=UPI0011BF77D6|nr:peptide-methionine (S)-S-oxide reductase MsrA [Psychroflexus gondwanensis]TXE18252.1 peptide-methionine (S)-S-oxide reductase MsrA [Psychroflexus gondwanensis]
MKSFYSLILLSILFVSCGKAQNSQTTSKLTSESFSNDTYERAYFASGCFWCVETIYESVSGVEEVFSGYSGGHTKNPTYESSNTGRTGHAEAVEVIYDPKVVSFKTLIDVYFGSQNVTQQNGQGPDIGSQYRSIIFYQNEDQKAIIDTKMESLSKEYNKPLAAEVMAFDKFWMGEEYHQDYKVKNPNNPYIRNVSVPRYTRFKVRFPELLKPKSER